MRFTAGDLSFTASITDVHEEPSPQTGAAVKWLTIQFRAQSDDMHAQALAAASERSRGGVFSASEVADEPDLEWRVADSSVQFVGNPPWGVNHHTWVIQQVERVSCTSLHIGALALEPYDYREQLTSDGALRLVVRAPASDAVLARLCDLHLAGDAVDVVRSGISDAPRPMLVDAYVWGSGSRGQGVVARCSDVSAPRVSLDSGPDEGGLLRQLLGLLEVQGLVDAKLLRERHHAARKVLDLDAWDL